MCWPFQGVTGVLGAMGPACMLVCVHMFMWDRKKMCVNVYDLPIYSKPHPWCVWGLCHRAAWGFPIYTQAGLYMCSRGPCNAGKVPLQHSVVLHNVSTAAGDDASHNHAQDEAPTLRTGPRGAAGIDNGDTHLCSGCSCPCTLTC